MYRDAISRRSAWLALADINLGNQGIWKGDEALLIEDLRVLHGVNGG